MRAASNPGGPGHAFVKMRFGIAERIDQPIYQPERGRLFIPSRLDDNEHLDREQYRESLQELDPFTRSQLESGDWSEYTGGYFKKEWCKVLDREPDDVEKKVRSWDFAATEAKPGKDPDWAVGTLIGRTRKKQYVVLDVVRTRATPLGVEQLVRRTAERDGHAVHIVIEEEAGSAGKIVSDHYRRVVLPGFVVNAVRSTGKKSERFAPFSSMAEAGNVSIVGAPWNGPWLEELCGFDGTGKGHDDQCDSVSLGYSALCQRQRFWMTGPDGTVIREEEGKPAERGEWDGKPRAFKTFEEFEEWVRSHQPDGTETVEPMRPGRIDLRANAPGWISLGRGFGRW
jgi:predicted phage terminase large subunit-like protein